MKATRQEIARAKTLTELESLQRRYNYQYPWAIKIHAARQRKLAGY